MHTLTLVDGPGSPRTFTLEHRLTRAGRGTDNDVVLDGRRVSKRHVLFSVRSDNTVQVEDLNSRNGVWIEEQRVTERILRPGEIVRVGECELRYDLVDSRSWDPDRSPSKVDTGFKLLWADGKGAFDEIPLLSECVYLGKGEDNEIVLPGPDVSRRHAMLCLRDGNWQIHDLESTNGTFVKGRRVDQAVVLPGARIRIGGVLLTLEGPRASESREDLFEDAEREDRRRCRLPSRVTRVVLFAVLLIAIFALAAFIGLRLLGR